MERNRKRKNGATKEYISIQSTVNVTVSSQAEKRVGYIDKFMSKADFTARNGKQVCIKEETHERIMKFVSVVGKGQTPWQVSSRTSSTSTSTSTVPK